MSDNKEAQARVKIDEQLRKAGWDPANASQVRLEEAAGGNADYVLLNQQGAPLAVIEAKKLDIDPILAEQQARQYAEQIAAPFIFLANGEITYFWDYQHTHSRLVDGFFTQADLERVIQKRKIEKPLNNIPIPDKVFNGQDELSIRPYQKEAMRLVDTAINEKKRRMLLEMATGTGKTLTIALIIKRLFEANRIHRVLFLVDRRTLAEQAEETFKTFLPDYPTKIWFGGRVHEFGSIVIGTLPTIASELERLGPAHFDLVVTDECHRSIYNTYRKVLDHFDAIHIGLTATPNLGQYNWLNEKEKQLIRNTYEFYHCWDPLTESGKPVFSCGILEGIKDKFLANYDIYLARTRITLEGLQWEGIDYSPSDLERRVTVEGRNRLMVKEYIERERQRGGESRKALVFAVTKNHAAQLKRLFDDELPEYGGKFAQIVTTDTLNPSEMIRKFKREEFPKVVISVGMLDAGFDAPDIENVIMMRPTTSMILYQQMRGRGSRLSTKIGKDKFLIYDFVGNAERFNDPQLENAIPGEKKMSPAFVKLVEGEEEKEAKVKAAMVVVPEAAMADEFKQQEMIHVGPEGLAIDRQSYKAKFEAQLHQLEKDKIIKKVLSESPLTDEELVTVTDKLNSPEYFFNEDNLREAYQQPAGSLMDFILHALGRKPLPTKEERLTQRFLAWLQEQNFSMAQTKFLHQLKERVLAGDEQIELNDFGQQPFLAQGGIDYVLKLFSEQQLKSILEELNNRVLAQ